MIHIIEDLNTEITASQFDSLISRYLCDLLKDFTYFKIDKRTKVANVGLEYKISIKVAYATLGIPMIMLVECHKKAERLDIEDIQKMSSKMKLIKANRGIVFSSFGFKQEAYNYAKNNGIALIKIVEGRYTYNLRSYASPNFVLPEWVDTPEFAGEYRHTCKKTNKETLAFIQEDYMGPLIDFIFLK